ncbi:chromate transporter [Gluconacetobacter johannae DSM 13595]|uniref:Chromate transporter n=1 Tax=Gluconacetobacter johannae TaxID=112140 RepID=A0A7W4JA71_9PROT|nr:chromate transporter [Gluconacetobacter johannae]MBB2177413.1 chromate transporter [Gluconacetobacter johannae]GBQ85435.1 chromate transporter [Gluconacetobacter johannae DSM 13595]
MADETIVETSHRKSPEPWQIANLFARYANFTWGGGSATVSVLHKEIIDRRDWLSESEFTLCFALARLIPGTNLLAFCTGIGWMARRGGGAVCALLGASVPSALLVLVCTMLFSFWEHDPIVQAAIRGAVACAVAVTVRTAWVIARPHVVQGSRTMIALVAVGSLVLYWGFDIPAIDILLSCAVVGALLPVARA